jgi:hypothetical protein
MKSMGVLALGDVPLCTRAAQSAASLLYEECEARYSASHCLLIQPRDAAFTPSGNRILPMVATAISTLTALTMNSM